ncbi:LemA family protein, partial [Vibrio sagamiensis]|uniref:LemA family protein n=1 Tax=Vibrio sagamiensis TaxID=512650 RepID=UPI0011BFB786
NAIDRLKREGRLRQDVISQERQKNKIIPNLEELANQYKGFEYAILKQITELRTAINDLDDSSMDKVALGNAETKTKDLVAELKVAVENYPELKASNLYNNIMKQIVEQQEDIGASIRIFNQNIELFNNGIQVFPNSLVNSVLNKKEILGTFKDSEAENAFEYKPNFS